MPMGCMHVGGRRFGLRGLAGWGRRGAFTLIELLIVVAIIAILAAIAVPNFLEAQVRAKVSRVKADLRTIATGLESYAVDYNRYPPNDGAYNVVSIQLSTPIAYISESYLVDPFCEFERTYQWNAPSPELARYYTYNEVLRFESLVDLALWVGAGNPDPYEAGADCPGRNEGATERYGKWRMSSNGPDRKYSKGDRVAGPFNPHPLVLLGCDVPYDPTNGTVSDGNILRTQRSSDGLAPAVEW